MFKHVFQWNKNIWDFLNFSKYIICFLEAEQFSVFIQKKKKPTQKNLPSELSCAGCHIVRPASKFSFLVASSGFGLMVAVRHEAHGWSETIR